MIKQKEVDYNKINNIKRNFKNKITEQRNLLFEHINKTLIDSKIINKSINLNTQKDFRENYVKKINTKIEEILKEFNRGENTIYKEIKNLNKEQENLEKIKTDDVIKESQITKKKQLLDFKKEDVITKIKTKQNELDVIQKAIIEIKKTLEKNIKTTKTNIRNTQKQLGKREFCKMKLTNYCLEINNWEKEVDFLKKELNTFNGYNKRIIKIKKEIM